MSASQFDELGRAVVEGNGQPAALHNRRLKLRNLIALGQVGIEVVFARKNRALIDLGTHGQTKLHRPLDRTFIHHRQRARHRQINDAGLRVRRSAKRGAAARKNL
jgi:hypothetical protein